MRASRPISPLYFAGMLVAAYTGAGIFQFPRGLVSTGGSDAGWAYLLECAAALFGMWLWFQVNHLEPSKPLTGFVGRLVTPLVGWPLLTYTVVLHLLLAVFVVVNFALVMNTFFLPNTPIWALEISIVLVATYMAWIDTRVLGRTIQVLYLPTALLSVMMGLLLLPKLRQAWSIVPSDHLHLATIGLAAYHGFYIFWGYEITLTLYPFVESDQRRRAERYAYAAMIATFLFFAFGYALVMGAEGPYVAAHAQWPGVSAMRLINVNSFLVNKLGLFLVTLWSLFAFMFVATRLWCTAHDVRAAFGLGGITSYRWLLGVGALAAVLVAQLFPNVEALTQFFFPWVNPAMVLFNFGLPAVLLGAAAFGRAWAAWRARPFPSS
jgi:spore germination protein